MKSHFQQKGTDYFEECKEFSQNIIPTNESAIIRDSYASGMEAQFESEMRLLESTLVSIVKFSIKNEKNYTQGVRITIRVNSPVGLIYCEFTGGGSYTTSKVGTNLNEMKTISEGHTHSSIGELINYLERNYYHFEIFNIEKFEKE